MEDLIQTFRNMGTTRLAIAGLLVVGLLAFLGFFVMRFSTPQMQLLYSGLDPADAQRIVKQLEAQKIPYQLANNGTELLVPGDQQQRLRLETANTLSGGANFGYELFDNQSAIGQTNFVQNLNMQRALEGELARTVESISSIKRARVHLVLPKREMFSRVERTPSASVTLAMAGGSLSPENILAIQSLIAAAVPQLQPNQVSIVDNRGNLLARINDNPSNMLISNVEEMRRQKEFQMTQAVQEILNRTVGADNSTVQVTVDMDLDRTITNETLIVPDSSVPISTVTREEGSSTNEVQADSVSVAQNLPDANANTGATGTAATSSTLVEETTNFDVSRQTVNRVTEGGGIKRVSVAVVLDHKEVLDANGQSQTPKVYEPLSAEELAQITALVEKAVGYNPNRGDQIQVENLRFADVAVEEIPSDIVFMGFTKQELMSFGESMGVVVVAILVILLIVRPLITKWFESMPQPGDAAAGRRLLTEQASAAGQLAGPGGRAPIPGGALPEEMEADELIDIDKVEGRVRASSLKKIGEIVDKHPEEALSIVRNWLYADTAP